MNKQVKKIYFVRHAESESNAAGLISGALDDIVLTKKGRDQAKAAGQRLRDKNIELVVCSPLKRTLETAAIIAKEIGYDPEKILTNPLLVERSYGVYEGRPREIWQKAVATGNVHATVESEAQMHVRLKKALEWVNGLDGKTILIVSHGGASRAVRVIAEDLHHSHMYKLESMENTEIYKFQLTS